MQANKKYKYILWDIDDTLINFNKSQYAALNHVYEKYSIKLTNKEIELYDSINHNYWKLLDENKISKKELLTKRFDDFHKMIDINNIDSNELNENYQKALGDFAVLNNNAFELCSKLKDNYKQYAITNGTKIAQDKKLKLTGLDEILDDIFISEVIGVEKPNINFFNFVFSNITNFNKCEALVIGDTLTSDIKGAMNVNIDSCFFNPSNKFISDEFKPTYVIKSLDELYEFFSIEK